MIRLVDVEVAVVVVVDLLRFLERISNIYCVYQGLTQELKDLKKRYEAIEDELANSKKRLSKEMSDLTQYYEQRVSFYSIQFGRIKKEKFNYNYGPEIKPQ
jgi:predicted  nucleic acid-binding Zn-ribbon protein